MIQNLFCYSKPGEMATETSYRPPSYAAAWPALTHSFMIGKKEYPFRAPEPESKQNSFRKGGSLWDNNDYFFNKADISSKNEQQRGSGTSENLIRFSDSEHSSTQPRNDQKQEIAPYRPSSISSQIDTGYSQMVHPISNRYSFQREMSQVVKHNQNDSFQDDRRIISTASNGDRRITSSADVGRSDDDDVVVEVRIPSRYLKQPRKSDYNSDSSLGKGPNTSMDRRTPYAEDVTPSVHKRSYQGSQSGSEKPNSSKNKGDDPKDV